MREKRRQSIVTIVDKHGRWALCPILLTVIKSTNQVALRSENMPRRVQLENIFLSRLPHKSANYVRSITRSLELSSFFFRLRKLRPTSCFSLARARLTRYETSRSREREVKRHSFVVVLLSTIRKRPLIALCLVVITGAFNSAYSGAYTLAGKRALASLLLRVSQRPPFWYISARHHHHRRRANWAQARVENNVQPVETRTSSRERIANSRAELHRIKEQGRFPSVECVRWIPLNPCVAGANTRRTFYPVH